MAEISAATVMKLRKMTGQGMMDCKKALVESQGDMDKAIEVLKKRGLATLEKRATRETSEGAVISDKTEDGKTAAMATLCCETDFVARSDDFIATTNTLKKYLLQCAADQGAEALLKTKVDGRTFDEYLTETVSKTGEKLQIGEYVKFKLDGPGFIKTYIHFNKKVGTMVKIETSDDKTSESQQLQQAANDIAMHITAMNPLALDEDHVDAKVIDSQRQAFAEQVKDKPENIIDKIVEGKLRKFFSERCLLAQPFVKDDSKSVREIIEEAASQAGGKASVSDYIRLDVG